MMCPKEYIIHGFHNIPGWHTRRKIVVFESDDWGSVRMPSLDVYHELREKNVPISAAAGYDINDTLASNDDMELLMDALSTVVDSNGHNPIITQNFVVANPDFEKIEKDGFQSYYYELFTDTLKRYPRHDRSFQLCKEGIARKLFQPQFHGREHLNVQLWLKVLAQGDPCVQEAYRHQVFSMHFNVQNDVRTHVLAAYNVAENNEYDFICESVKEGLEIFNKVFGFNSLSMIAPCYTWDYAIERTALECGVRILQGGMVQVPSVYAKSQGARPIRHYTGQTNVLGQIYTIRTCNFEPTQSVRFTADSCMKEIELDFRCHKPAIVSCHRLNFIGDLNPVNRDNSLRELKKLLRMIVKKYPDVEFMSSDEIGMTILNDINVR